MPRFDSLPAWLAWQETLHPKKIDLGLERVREVAGRMGLLQPEYGVITVAGTNGKGSSVTMLAAILEAAGYRTGSYTSPHLQHYNERVRIASVPASDADLCRAFECVDQARGQQSLSYFEFGTLAALQLFAEAGIDIAVLEVGLGGRLDAVNIIDPDAALVTAIDIDHSAWLGPDRETIAREKAGIFRRGRPAVCSDPAPPASLEAAAAALDAEWLSLGRQYSYTLSANRWNWRGPQQELADLPPPGLPGRHQFDNAAGVLMVLDSLRDRYPVSRRAIEKGLQDAVLPGRFQILPGEVDVILDVAHNPASGKSLARLLAEHPAAGQTWLVLGMLNDKDAAAFTGSLRQVVDQWCLATLDVERGLTAAQLRQSLPAAITSPLEFPGVAAAFCHARSHASAGDRVVVCGSFVTVAEALACHV